MMRLITEIRLNKSTVMAQKITYSSIVAFIIRLLHKLVPEPEPFQDHILTTLDTVFFSWRIRA